MLSDGFFQDDDSIDKDGNYLDGECSRPQKHARSPELAREFLLDAATVIFKEQVRSFADLVLFINLLEFWVIMHLPFAPVSFSFKLYFVGGTRFGCQISFFKGKTYES